MLCKDYKSLGEIKKHAIAVFENYYGKYIDQFNAKGINVELIAKKARARSSTVIVEVTLIPSRKDDRRENRFWKSFAVKLMKIKKMPNKYVVSRIWSQSILLNAFFRYYLKKAEKVSLYKVCEENIPNCLLRAFCFARHGGVPKKYRNFNIEWLYFLILIIFIGIIIAITPNWYPWY